MANQKRKGGHPRSAPAPAAAKNKKSGYQVKLPVIVVATILVLLTGGILGGLLVMFTNTPDESGALAGADVNWAQDEPPAAPPVAIDFPYELTVGDITLSRAEYNFYFTDLMQRRHSDYFWEQGVEPFDMTIPLEAQPHGDGTQTWADYIHGLIEDRVRQYVGALEAGTVLTQADIDHIDEYMQWLREEAESSELTVDAFLSGFFEGMTEEMFARYLERDTLLTNWRAAEAERLTFTQEELERFFYANWESIDPWSNGVRNTDPSHADTRHILLAFPDNTREPTPEEVETAREAAEAIFAEWMDGEATEDSFARLATERTEDFASAAAGGLYTDIFPGQMVPEFDAWVFDENRRPGDTGIVQTDFGFHIMYFVQAHIDWVRRAETAMHEAAFEEITSGLAERFPAERRRV